RVSCLPDFPADLILFPLHHMIISMLNFRIICLLPKHLSLKFINALCDHRGTFTSLRLTENSEHSLHISPLFFFRRIWIIMIQLTFHDAVDTAGMKSYLLHTATSFFL